MSAFNASLWAITFDGTPPQPSVQQIHEDRSWYSMGQAREWIAIFYRVPYGPVHAVFIVGRDCNTVVLTWEQATAGVCRACGCQIDKHGCGCNPHDA